MKIIAEFCQNHNGKFDTLLKMVEAAARAGATHGKMQSINANTLVFRPEFEEGLSMGGAVKCIKRPFQNEYDRMKGLEISDDDTVKFIDACMSVGLVPMTTCFTRGQVSRLHDLGFNSLKVASYDCASFQMLREVKDRFHEIIVSTGATYDEEIELASQILKDRNFGLLHCVTIYPTPFDSLNLARMNWLRNFTEQVGFSDHSNTAESPLIASKVALLMGADIIERHFTILPAEETRDGPVSINEFQLKELVQFSALDKNTQLELIMQERPTWKGAVGVERRELSDQELLNRAYYRGRFATPVYGKSNRKIYNWEEVSFNAQ